MVFDQDSAAPTRRSANPRSERVEIGRTAAPDNAMPQWAQPYSLSSPEMRSFYTGQTPQQPSPSREGLTQYDRSERKSSSAPDSYDPIALAVERFNAHLERQEQPRSRHPGGNQLPPDMRNSAPETPLAHRGPIQPRYPEISSRQQPSLRLQQEQFSPPVPPEQRFEANDGRPMRILPDGKAIPQTKTGDKMAINIQEIRNINRVIAQHPNWVEMDLRELSKNNQVDRRTGQITNPIVDKFHAAGIGVIAYLNAGASQQEYNYPNEVKGHTLNGYPNEHYLDIRKIGQPGDKVGPVLDRLMKSAAAMKVDAVDPDNVDSWDNTTGFGLNYQHGLKFNKWLADTARNNGLAIMLKNNGKQAKDLEPYFDGAVTEEALRPKSGDPRADAYRAFTAPRQNGAPGKAVFELQYQNSTREVDERARQYGYTLIRQSKHLSSFG